MTELVNLVATTSLPLVVAGLVKACGRGYHGTTIAYVSWNM